MALAGAAEAEAAAGPAASGALADDNPVMPPVPSAVADALAKKDWPGALKLAIQAGWRNENDLADLLFYARHPELARERLDPKAANFKQLSDEWGKIRETEVWNAIIASAENKALGVAGKEVAEHHQRFFRGERGRQLKELVEEAARKADLDPGLLGTIMMAETRDPRLYFSRQKVSSYTVGCDDFYEARAAIKARVPAYESIGWDKNQTPIEHDNDAIVPRKVKTILFDSGKDATLATAVYVKFREVRLRERAAEMKGDFDKLPRAVRFALTRIAMAAGTGGATPFLKDALGGKDIFDRRPIPVRIFQTKRNATVRTAQALHLSDWVFGNRMPSTNQPEAGSGQGEVNNATKRSGEEEAPPASWTPQCTNFKRIISGFPEYAVTPDQLGAEQQAVLLQIALEIAASFNTDTPIVDVVVAGHADVALRKPLSERSAFEQSISDQRANNALKLIMGEVSRLAGASGAPFLSAMQTRAMGVGSTQRLVSNPRSESERRLNRRVEVLFAQCRLPPGPPPPVRDDELEQRVRRVLKLLETRRVDPDTTGTRTVRARCLLQKFLKPGVIDVFVDGGVANQTINGITPGYYDCIIPGRNVGWLGNYDRKQQPMPWREFMKFLATVSPILRGPAFAPSQNDEWLLKALGDVVYRIDLGIEITDQYIARMGMMSDPLVQPLFQKDGFAGDQARKKLQSLYRGNLEDENNIYSCWR